MQDIPRPSDWTDGRSVGLSARARGCAFQNACTYARPWPCGKELKTKRVRVTHASNCVRADKCTRPRVCTLYTSSFSACAQKSGQKQNGILIAYQRPVWTGNNAGVFTSSRYIFPLACACVFGVQGRLMTLHARAQRGQNAPSRNLRQFLHNHRRK